MGAAGCSLVGQSVLRVTTFGTFARGTPSSYSGASICETSRSLRRPSHLANELPGWPLLRSSRHGSSTTRRKTSVCRVPRKCTGIVKLWSTGSVASNNNWKTYDASPSSRHSSGSASVLHRSRARDSRDDYQEHDHPQPRPPRLRQLARRKTMIAH